MVTMIISIVLIILTFLTLGFFVVANQNIISVRKKFARLANANGISVDQKILGISRMRSLSSEMNSDQSRELLARAEILTKSYLIRFRAFLAVIVLGATVAVLSNFYF